MAIRFTHKRMTPGYNDHQHISHLKWVGIENGEVGSNRKTDLVTWADDGGRAYVGTGSSAVPVGVVHPSSGHPYLRTYADGKWTNNLLSLPDF